MKYTVKSTPMLIENGSVKRHTTLQGCVRDTLSVKQQPLLGDDAVHCSVDPLLRLFQYGVGTLRDLTRSRTQLSVLSAATNMKGMVLEEALEKQCASTRTASATRGTKYQNPNPI